MSLRDMSQINLYPGGNPGRYGDCLQPDPLMPYAAGLAFSRRMPQDAPAILVLACLSATRPFLGRSFQDTHYIQIVRPCAPIRAWNFVMEANHGYRNCEIF